MCRRNPLKNIIIDAWHACIEYDYVRQRINSERSLQASFWAQLNQKLPATRRIFIEPSIKVTTASGAKQLIPDIVICNTKEVISVIELKYLPRAQPKYAKDINSLATIAQKRKHITISNSRFRGTKVDNKQYPLSSNMLFIWAGIHATLNQEITDLYSKGYKSLTDSFIQLHAATTDNQQPEIYWYE